MRSQRGVRGGGQDIVRVHKPQEFGTEVSQWTAWWVLFSSNGISRNVPYLVKLHIGRERTLATFHSLFFKSFFFFGGGAIKGKS